MDDFVRRFIYSDFMDDIIVYRLQESIYNVREEIDNMTMKERSRDLTEEQREQYNQMWEDVEMLIKCYEFYSGDWELKNLRDWKHN